VNNVTSLKAELFQKKLFLHLMKVCQISALVKFKWSFSMYGSCFLRSFRIYFYFILILSFFLFIISSVKFHMIDFNVCWCWNKCYHILTWFHFKQFILFCGSFSSFFIESLIIKFYFTQVHEFIFIVLFQRNKIKYIYTK
jgi:hypothetical protein